jgi:hypothetical protein
MSHNIIIYRTGDFIRKTEMGHLDLERSIEIVQQLAEAAGQHSDCDILLDLRDTDSSIGYTDIMGVAREFVRHRFVFQNKIALIIPENEQRYAKTQILHTCLDLEGFQAEVFVSYEEAIDWLSNMTVFPPDPT